SMQYYLLCDLLAKHGLDPLADVTIEEVTPPRMPSYLRQGRLDGALTPEPFGQITVLRGKGFIHTLSRDLWAGHPCCALAATQPFLERYPRTAHAVLRSVIQAELALHHADSAERRRMAAAVTYLGYWNPEDTAAI